MRRPILNGLLQSLHSASKNLSSLYPKSSLLFLTIPLATQPLKTCTCPFPIQKLKSGTMVERASKMKNWVFNMRITRKLIQTLWLLATADSMSIMKWWSSQKCAPGAVDPLFAAWSKFKFHFSKKLPWWPWVAIFADTGRYYSQKVLKFLRNGPNKELFGKNR